MSAADCVDIQQFVNGACTCPETTQYLKDGKCIEDEVSHDGNNLAEKTLEIFADAKKAINPYLTEQAGNADALRQTRVDDEDYAEIRESVANSPFGKAIGGFTEWDNMIRDADGSFDSIIQMFELITVMNKFFATYTDAVNTNYEAISNGNSPAGMPCNITAEASGCNSSENLTCASDVPPPQTGFVNTKFRKYMALKTGGDPFEHLSQIHICIDTTKCGGEDAVATADPTYLCGAIHVGATLLTVASIVFSM